MYQEKPLGPCSLASWGLSSFCAASERQVCWYPCPDGCHTSINPRKTNSPTSVSPAGHSSNKPLAGELTAGQRSPRVSLDDGEERNKRVAFNNLSDIKRTSTLWGLQCAEENKTIKDEWGSRRVGYKENVTWIAAEMPGALTETGMHVGFLT